MIKKCLVALVIVVIFSHFAHSQVVKLGTIAPEGSPWVNGLKKLAQDWDQISDGRVKVRIYPGGVAGDDPDMIRKMRIGQLHGAAITTAGLSHLYSDITSLTFPDTIKTNEELEYVIKKMKPYFDKKILEKGFNVLNWSNAGWVHFFSKRPIVTPDDLRKQKLFYWGMGTKYIEAFKKAGFQPIPLSITDLMSALQTGMVDVFAAPPTAALSFQWYTQAPNMCDLRWQPLPALLVITKRKWDQLPANLRPKLLESAQRMGLDVWKEVLKVEDDAVKAMEKNGLKTHAVTPEAKEKWSILVKESAYPVFVGHRFSKEVYDMVLAAVKEYREQQQKK